jgi:hypothetical protein
MKNKKNGSTCISRIGNDRQSLSRLTEMSILSSELLDYALHYGEILACVKDKKALTEKAYNAELKTRLLLNHGIDVLNEGFDSGIMDVVFRDMHRMLENGKQPDIAEAIKTAKEHISHQFPEMETGFLDEALKLIDKVDIKFSAGKDAIQVESRVGDGKPIKQSLSLTRLPGSIGRVSSREFFSNSGKGVVSASALGFNDETCHHKPLPGVSDTAHVHDTYGKLLSSFAYLRDTVYRHARVIEDFGQPHIKANDVGSAIVIGLIFAGLAVAGVGLYFQMKCFNHAEAGVICDAAPFILGGGLLLAGIMGLCYTGCKAGINQYLSMQA